MGLNNPTAGYSYAAEFQSSGIPWVTSSIAASGSATQFQFQCATRFITVANTGGANQTMAFGFTQNGMSDTNSNRYALSGSQSVTLELRCKTVFVMGLNSAVSFSLLAGLTTVLASNTPLLTGSQIDISSNTTASWPGVG